MEQPKFNDIQKEIAALRASIESTNIEQNTLDKIGFGLDRIEELLDPRPPVSLNNFCPNCGHDLNNFNTSNGFLDL